MQAVEKCGKHGTATTESTKHSPEEACASITVAICHPKEAANSDWIRRCITSKSFVIFFTVLQNLTIQTYPNNQLKHVLELKPNQHPLDFHHFPVKDGYSWLNPLSTAQKRHVPISLLRSATRKRQQIQIG